MFDVNAFLNGGTAKVPHGGFDNIKFVGLLAKTETNGEPFYFTFDIDGNAIAAFAARKDLGALCFNIVTDTPEAKVEKVKPASKVEVVRYFRPLTEEGTTHNMGGMTAICILDYDNMSLTVYPSFCMDCDNFEKSEGLIYARENQTLNLGFVVDLDRSMSIQDNIYYGLTMDLVVFKNKESYAMFRSPLKRAITNYVG